MKRVNLFFIGVLAYTIGVHKSAYAMEKIQVPSPEIPQWFKDKALRLGAWCGSDCVNVCIEHGADANCANGDGETLLMWAASEGNKNMVTTLLSLGAVIDVQDKIGRTALWYAYQQPTKVGWNVHANQEMFELLLKHGANINHRKKNGSTLLLNSTKWEAYTFVPFLIECGADVTALDKKGRDVLDRMQTIYEFACSRTVSMHGDFRTPKKYVGINRLPKA